MENTEVTAAVGQASSSTTTCGAMPLTPSRAHSTKPTSGTATRRIPMTFHTPALRTTAFRSLPAIIMPVMNMASGVFMSPIIWMGVASTAGSGICAQ